LITWLLNLGCRWRRLLSGAFIFVEAAAFRKLGGFSNQAFAGEDLELGRRLKKLARETEKRLVILHRHPVTTSARRMRHFSILLHLQFMLRIIFNRPHVTTNREAAHLWYDARR